MSTKNKRPRNRIDLYTPAEKAIYNAMLEVEKMPPSVHLTDAVVLLEQAKNKVADFIDEDMPIDYEASYAKFHQRMVEKGLWKEEPKEESPTPNPSTVSKESVEEAAKKMADIILPYVWPKNGLGEEIVQRVGQNAPFSKKHRKEQQRFIHGYKEGFKAALQLTNSK